MKFLQNKYTIWYYNIISRAKSRDKNTNVYFEKHHIVPQSLGGNNSKAKIAESNRRRVYSDETRAKISAGVKAANLKRQFVSTTFLI